MLIEARNVFIFYKSCRFLHVCPFTVCLSYIFSTVLPHPIKLQLMGASWVIVPEVGHGDLLLQFNNYPYSIVSGSYLSSLQLGGYRCIVNVFICTLNLVYTQKLMLTNTCINETMVCVTTELSNNMRKCKIQGCNINRNYAYT